MYKALLTLLMSLQLMLTPAAPAQTIHSFTPAQPARMWWGLIDPELSVRDRAMWGLFCTWGGEFVITDGLRKTYSEQYTDKEMLTKVYNSEYVVTRDELPDLKTYPIREDAN